MLPPRRLWRFHRRGLLLHRGSGMPRRSGSPTDRMPPPRATSTYTSIRAQWPRVEILLRADCHYVAPEVFDWLPSEPGPLRLWSCPQPMSTLPSCRSVGGKSTAARFKAATGVIRRQGRRGAWEPAQSEHKHQSERRTVQPPRTHRQTEGPEILQLQSKARLKVAVLAESYIGRLAPPDVSPLIALPAPK